MPSPIDSFFDKQRLRFLHDLSLLFLRLSVAMLMLFGHGWGKLMNFSERAGQFSDPIGLGPTLSLALAVFAEVFCSALIGIGMYTRYAVIPPLILTLVAATIVHAADPWVRQELPLMYLVIYFTLFLTGPGRFSMDHRVRRHGS